MPVSRPKTPLFSSKRAGEYDSHACAPARARRLAARREIPRGRNEHNRTRYAAGRWRPALPTTSSVIKPNVHVVISSVSNVVIAINRINSPYTLSFRAKSRNPPRQKRNETYTRRPTCLWRLATEKSPRERNENKRTRTPQTLACAGSAPHTPVFLPFGQIECRKVVCKYLQNERLYDIIGDRSAMNVPLRARIRTCKCYFSLF